jgi:hypothetical protein
VSGAGFYEVDIDPSSATSLLAIRSRDRDVAVGETTIEQQERVALVGNLEVEIDPRL